MVFGGYSQLELIFIIEGDHFKYDEDKCNVLISSPIINKRMEFAIKGVGL